MNATDGSDAASIIRRAAMDMLARREHSCFELQQKLTRKYPEIPLDGVILPALHRLQEENLQSDARFVESFVRYRSSRGVGPLKITAELYPKRVDEALLSQALDEIEDWAALCLEVLQKKFIVTDTPSMPEQLKWSRFLQQRGFSSEQIRQALRQVETTQRDH